MASGLAKKFYRVKVTDSKGKLRLYDLGGKTYTSEAAARTQFDRMVALGVECELWSTAPVVWNKISSYEPLDNDPELPLDYS